MKKLPREQQIRILKRINRLLDAEREGEDHTEELKRLGDLLAPDDRPKYQPDHITDGEYKKYMKVAKKNKIPMRVYKDRLRRGKPAREAATKPYVKKSEIPEIDYILKAKENGISRRTYHWRRRKGWNKEEAATTPIIITGAAAKIRKEKGRPDDSG